MKEYEEQNLMYAYKRLHADFQYLQNKYHHVCKENQLLKKQINCFESGKPVLLKKIIYEICKKVMKK